MADIATLHRILNSDPIWSAYALADLQPGFALHCRWHPVETPRGSGLALFFDGLQPPVVFTMGAPAVVASALRRAELPKEVYISVRSEHFALLNGVYDFSRDLRPMWRMFLPPTAPVAAETAAGLVRLTPYDARRLQGLYACGGPFAPDAFEPYQLENGVFVGIANGRNELVAAGGTHIVDWQRGVAAIGNMYTRPDYRGQGLAATIVLGIAAALRGEGVSLIVLNVDQRNEIAFRLYRRAGFVVHCPFLEGTGQRRKSTTRYDELANLS